MDYMAILVLCCLARQMCKRLDGDKNLSTELEQTRPVYKVTASPEQQPCLGSLGESASSLSVASWLSTSSAVSGVTNWCSTASAMIF